MITIKDFQKGDKVYILTRNRGRNTGPTICESEVVSVGRIYVTIGSNTWSRKFSNDDSEFLKEKVDCGEASFLFKTRKDAEEYIEKCDLALWLGLLSVTKAEKYSLEQLKKVKAILKS